MIHDSDNQTRDSFVFWEGLLRGYCLHASVITPCSLVEGGGVEQCEKRRGSRESLVSGVWWWMVHAVWLRAHMNKHIRLRFVAQLGDAMRWYKKKRGGKWKKRWFDYGYCAKEIGLWLNCRWCFEGYSPEPWIFFFPFPNENTSSDYTLLLYFTLRFYFKTFVLPLTENTVGAKCM